MKWITHIALAILIIKITGIAFLTNLLNSHLAWVVASLFAVFPDFDSFVGLKHRTYTHTVYSALIASYPLIFVDLNLFFVGLISYFSHLLGDMMTHSGVKLFYPIETVYYLTPPSWRLKTGSSAEFFALGIILLASIGLGYVGEASEIEKVFKLSTENDVAISLSYFENGAIYRLDSVKVVWTDGRNNIGIIHDGKFKKISKSQILDLEILDIEDADRRPRSSSVHLKTLKRSMWKHRVIVSYSMSDEEYYFTGTGYDLYKTLKKKYDDDTKIKLWFYEAR